jgi:hypothetical protein
VKANQGSASVDGNVAEEVLGAGKAHSLALRHSLRAFLQQQLRFLQVCSVESSSKPVIYSGKHVLRF